MTKDQFQREKDYRVAVSIAKSMLEQGIISKQDYKIIDAKLTKKYAPALGSLSV